MFNLHEFDRTYRILIDQILLQLQKNSLCPLEFESRRVQDTNLLGAAEDAKCQVHGTGAETDDDSTSSTNMIDTNRLAFDAAPQLAS